MFLATGKRLDFDTASASVLRQNYASSSETKATKNKDLSFKSSDGGATLTLAQGDLAKLSSPEGNLTGRFIFYDGTPLSSLFTVICSNLGPSCVFHCRGSSIVSQMGSVFFDEQGEDYKLVKEMNHIAQNLDAYMKSARSLPASTSRWFVYNNPWGNRPQRVVVSPDLNDEKPFEAGSIILLEQPDNARDFRLIGYYRRGQSLAAARTARAWRSSYPLQEDPVVSRGQDVMFIFCERPFTTVVAFLRSHLLVGIGIAFGACIGLLVMIKLSLVRSNAKLRTKPKASS
jgi:hypothetical protein